MGFLYESIQTNQILSFSYLYSVLNILAIVQTNIQKPR